MEHDCAKPSVRHIQVDQLLRIISCMSLPVASWYAPQCLLELLPKPVRRSTVK